MQVVLFDLPKDRLDLFKELLQAEMDEVDDCPFCRATYFPYTHQYKRLSLSLTLFLLLLLSNNYPAAHPAGTITRSKKHHI